MSNAIMEAPAVEASEAVENVKPLRQRARKPASQKASEVEPTEKVTFRIAKTLDKKIAVHAAYAEIGKSKVVELALEAFLKRFVVHDHQKPEASPAV